MDQIISLSKSMLHLESSQYRQNTLCSFEQIIDYDIPYTAKRTTTYAWAFCPRRLTFFLIFLLNVVHSAAQYTTQTTFSDKIHSSAIRTSKNQYNATSVQSSMPITTNSSKSPNLSTSDSNRSRVIKFYMRSQRKRRSHEYYLLIDEKFALQIHCKLQIHSTVYRLSVTDAGVVRVTPATKPGDQMVISVIGDATNLLTANSPEKLLRPKDNARVIIRRFNSSLFVCMSASGVVTTERMQNHTISDNCEWRLRISSHGYGFQRFFYPDSFPTNQSTLEPQQPSVATLSVFRPAEFQIASGWMHKLWQPEATWLVYHAMITKVHSDNNGREAVAGGDQPSKPNMTNSVNNTSEEADIIRLGNKDVYLQGTTAYDIQLAYIKQQRSFCSQISRNLTILVQREIVESIAILSNLRSTISELDKLLVIKPSMFPTPPLTSLIQKWLILVSLRWEERVIRQLNLTEIYEQSHCQANKWVSTFGNEEHNYKQSFEKLYHDLFLKVQHLAHWTGIQRYRWIRRPRLSILFRHLGLRIPATSKIRWAIFTLTRYFNLTLSEKTVPLLFDAKLLKNDSSYLKKIIAQAMSLKFEEIIYWSGRIQLSDLVDYTALRSELLQLPEDSICFHQFYKVWISHRRKRFPAPCSLDHLLLSLRAKRPHLS